jgi:hypothetical protein
MVHLPLLDRAVVQGYGLFPGTSTAPGLTVEIPAGLTLVLGTNGLGKSTFVLMLYRSLTGPFDIPGIEERSELGTLKLQVGMLSAASRAVFARRVNDGAREATCQLDMVLGPSRLRIVRSLADLSLVDLVINEARIEPTEARFQEEIARAAEVETFGDWVLLLRHLTFYFEERRALVWDPTAQRQVLRILLLSSASSQRWLADERRILELDSEVRSLTYAYGKAERLLTQGLTKSAAGPQTRENLGHLESEQTAEREELERVGAELVELESQRQQLRLGSLVADQEREKRYRAVERARVLALGAMLPSASDGARFVLAQLLAERQCLVCGNNVPEAAQIYSERLDAGLCVVCASKLPEPLAHTHTDIVRLERQLAVADVRVSEARRSLAEASSSFDVVSTRVQELRRSIATRTGQIDALVRVLPPEEAQLHEQRSELSTLRSELRDSQEDLGGQRTSFKAFVDEMNGEIVQRSSAISEAFSSYAEGFLLEECELVWSPHRAPLGQSGQLFDFPAFELDLSGSNFEAPQRRSSPDQVSESQREFIDLSFRMALMNVATGDNSGTLVIDAPEASLDGVFSRRAATVLARFADPSRGNRLIATSNLSDGKLIPQLLANVREQNQDGISVLDLFVVATPTAAVRALGPEYEALRDEILNG